MNLNNNILSIEGLEIRKLKIFRDDRGGLMHYYKQDQFSLKQCKEIYFSITNEGVIKGWKFHTKIWQHMTVPYGSIEFFVFDNRPESPTKGSLDNFVLDCDKNYGLLIMPPKLWYSFKCISNGSSIIANTITEEHDPTESITIPLNDPSIPFCW